MTAQDKAVALSDKDALKRIQNARFTLDNMVGDKLLKFQNKTAEILLESIYEDIAVSIKILEAREAQEQGAMRPEWNIICLVGSVRQKNDWLKVTQNLTRKGYVVLEAGDYTTETEKPKAIWDKITEVHKQKIRMAAAIGIIKKLDGSVGIHTQADIDYAKSLGKQVVEIDGDSNSSTGEEAK